MMYRNSNYTAFYVDEPFSPSPLAAYVTKDFCYYNMLKAWKEMMLHSLLMMRTQKHIA